MKISEHIKFSLTMAILPWIPAVLLYKHSYVKAALIILCVFLFTSLICFISRKFALGLKNILMKIGSFLGRYIAIFVLFIGYIIAVLPTGMLMKIVKRDRLRLKKPGIVSYWIDYNNKDSDYEYQF